MRIQIVARKCQIPEPVRTRATEQVERLGRFDPTVQTAEVIFEEEKHRKSVEGILRRDGETPAVARGEGSEFRAALDQMLDRMQKILRRSRSQSTEHRGPRIAEMVEVPSLEADGE